MSPTMLQQAPVGDTTLAYRSIGDGDPVVLIHGGLVADTMLPIATAPELTALHRIVYHRRGYGDSPRPTPVQPRTLDEHAADALGLLDHLDVGAVHVVGHSLGALIGMVLAARHPDRVRSLALLEPPTAFGRDAAAAWLARVLPLVEVYAAGDATAAVSGFFDTIYRPGWPDRMERALPGAFEQSVQDASMGFGSDLPGLEWQEGLGADDVAAIRCPVLSVLGTATIPLCTDARTLLHGWFPWCQDVDVEGADHMLPIEHPRVVASAIASFLTHPARS